VITLNRVGLLVEPGQSGGGQGVGNRLALGRAPLAVPGVTGGVSP
jgi:hypothetical protein